MAASTRIHYLILPIRFASHLLRSVPVQLKWLRFTVAHLGNSFLSRLVAHRGFHDISDNLSRPVENSVEAYETAWSAGIKMCECDVALTSDNQVILCHDENFSRLALFRDPNSEKAIGETQLVCDIALFFRN